MSVSKTPISLSEFNRITFGMNHEDYTGKTIHSKRMGRGCQFILLSGQGPWLRVITPKTRKEYSLRVEDVYPSRATRTKIICDYRNRTSEEKVIERFGENYLPY